MRGKPVVIECKFDGDRLQLHKDGTKLLYFSRNGNDHQEFHHGTKDVLIKNIIPEKCILDGEMCVWSTSESKFLPFGANQEVAKQHVEDPDKQLPEVAALHPDPQVAAHVRVCDKLMPPTRVQSCNFTDVALSVAPDMTLPDSLNCKCRRAFPHCSDLVDGHVVSVDYNIISDDNLRKLFQEGSKYRLNGETADVLQALAIGLDEYNASYKNTFARHSRRASFSSLSQKLHSWRSAILGHCQSNATSLLMKLMLMLFSIPACIRAAEP
ncbi:hypothetical protein CBR_g50203 [Chara braunii]|uniref:ATP-dependent DNA ligase family profile domain-containing protein n=1 Tax=Chara braunii TaxID=69332 RepID=A0A388M6C9_CHABU|nr:hypothetical protein CBR_g50203 [Chara braunii]|eukprot:GBG90111.1 hypothetical protein CBR_g50203 [Chara braunii]